MIGDRSWQFTRAISRTPSASVVAGLRAEDTGTPDLDTMLRDHAQYIC